MDKDGRTHRFTSGNEVDSIAHDVVYSLLEDETGSLWVGTNGGGISIINPRKRDYVYFSYDHDDPSSLDNGKINAITQDDRGNYWVSVYNNGINYLSPTGRVLKRYKTADENSIGDQVKVFLKDSKNRFLAGTDKGIAYYDPETDSFLLWDILPDRNRIYDIVETEEGVFWIGTYDEGLLRYDPASGELKNYPLSDTKVFSMLLDSKNRLWVGTNNGLNRMDQGEEVFITYRHDEPELGDLPGNSIEDIIEDSEGRIWLATSGGAALYQEETNDFKAFTENTGLLSNNVSALLECEHHIIWAATQNGITLSDEVKDLGRTLTPEQGIGGWEFGSGAYIDRDGNIMFGGVHGVTRIPDLHNPDVGFDYRTQITQVKVNESPVEEGQFIYNDSAYIFEPDQRFMTIEFITIDYDSPMAVDYEYRLLGLEDEWRQNGSRNEVSFINLSAGRYVFEVRSRMPNGDYTAPVSFSFEIKQYWYLMWYAFIIYTMLVFGIVFVIFEMRNARELNKRNIELDHLNDRLEQANTQLEKISVEDSLTGLYNRRFFDMKLDEQLHLAKRSKTSLALIMIDLDNFKEVNDTMGHVIGDRYLQRIASILGDTLQRSTDFACRYGGDEFIIMMYDNSIDGTRMVAERIRETVRNMVLVDEYSGQKIQGTVSIGIISTIPPMDADGDTYLEAVDKAMYQAKNAGRNRISVAILGDDEEEAPKA